MVLEKTPRWVLGWLIFLNEIIIRRDLFRNVTFQENFKSLFEEDGILNQIYRKYPIAAAKGGSNFQQYRDTTYFNHALNVSYIAGLILENDLMNRDVSINNYDVNVKLLFSASVLHDINKLIEKGKYKAEEYDRLLKENSQMIAKLISPYFKGVGHDKLLELKEKLDYIILSVENQTKYYTGTIDIKDKKDLNYLAEKISFADKISSQMSSGADKLTVIKNINEKLNEKFHSSGFRTNVIWFNHVPQLLARNHIMSKAEKLLKDKILLKSPDAFIVWGDVDLEDLKREILSEFLSSNKDKSAIERAVIELIKPNNNGITTSFSEVVSVDEAFLEKYMDHWGEKLLLYEKMRDYDRKYHITSILKNWGYRINDNTKKIEYIKAEKDRTDVDLYRASLMVKTAILTLMQMALEDDTKYLNQEYKLWEDNGVPIRTDISLIMRRTLIALAFSYNNRSRIEDVYNKIIKRVASLLKTNNRPLVEVAIRELMDRVLPTRGRALYKKEPPSKEGVCIQCGGTFETTELKKKWVFGYKATAGTGLKVSSTDSEMYKGSICRLCIFENILRTRAVNNSSNNSICLQTYIGDFLPPINISNVIDLTFPDLVSHEDHHNEGESIKIKIGRKKIDIFDHHTVSFLGVDKENYPDNMREEYTLIKSILNIIRKTGIKFKISSMFISETPFISMFLWDNPPAWIKHFSLNNVRIDQIDRSFYILDLIGRISRLEKGEKSIPGIISKLMRNKYNIYLLLWEGFTKNNTRGSVFSKSRSRKLRNMLEGDEEWKGIRMFEEAYINMEERSEMDRLVEKALNIVFQNPETNNEHTWIIRLALSVYERGYRLAKKTGNFDDLKEKIAGRLWEVAKRTNMSNGIKNGGGQKTQQSVIDFSNAFVDFLNNIFDGLPDQETRRDIISQFALLYNIKKWKSSIYRGENHE